MFPVIADPTKPTGWPIYTPYPVNTQHPLNLGCLCWYLGIPNLVGGNTFYDLIGNNAAPFNSLGSGYGWAFPTRPKSYSRVVTGGGGYVAIPGSVLAQIGTTLTCALWIFPTSSLTAYDALLDSSYRAATFFLGGSANAAYVGLGYDASDTNGILAGSISLTSSFVLNTWQRLLYTGNTVTGAITVYINGALVCSTTLSPRGSATSASQVIELGANPSGGGANFGGSLDSIRIWNRVLSAQEAFQDYILETTGYPGVLNRLNMQPLRGASAPTSQRVQSVITPWSSYINIADY